MYNFTHEKDFTFPLLPIVTLIGSLTAIAAALGVAL
jgi:hypothetical protein